MNLIFLYIAVSSAKQKNQLIPWDEWPCLSANIILTKIGEIKVGIKRLRFNTDDLMS